MPPRFSAYLDILRFLAALTVFLGHASGQNWTGGFLWQAAAYSDSCVVVFFVLSGFVIAYVTTEKERRWQVYAAHRAARLWSVVIPALLLTAVIDYVGVRVAPEFYIDQPWYLGDKTGLRYLASLFLVHEAWEVHLSPGVNGPFWSLSFEAFYYLAFAVIVFARKMRWWLAGFVGLLAGPYMSAFFPLWLLGVAAFHMTRQRDMRPAIGAALVLLGTAVLLASPWIRHHQPPFFHSLPERLAVRYIDAAAFFANLVGAYGLLKSGKAFAPAPTRWIRLIAGSTFALYLFHRPLLQMFSYAGPADPSSWQRRVLVLGGTLLLVFLLTPLTDSLQALLRKFFLQPEARLSRYADQFEQNGKYSD